MQYSIDWQKILDATNGGLDIICDIFPQAREAIEKGTNKFKARTSERTPSAGLKKAKDGNWLLTDFGGDHQPRNGVQVYANEKGLQLGEAIAILADNYGIARLEKARHKSGFEIRAAKKDEIEGKYYFDYKEKLDAHELAELGPRVTQDVCTKFYVHAVHSFTQIKDRQALINTSNENYPIYVVDHGQWQKIYQPKHFEKQYRFRYVGTKPKDFIDGLDQVESDYKRHLKNVQDDPSISDEDKRKDQKLPEVILCSGDRDAWNVAGMGYPVLWRNSETAELPKGSYKKIMKMTETLYNIPDIDTTGIKEGQELGLRYLDIKTIWLPPKLKTINDARGNPRKDLKDFVEVYPGNSHFNKLLKVALPMRFWDESYSDKAIKYTFNNKYAIHFLWSNNFLLLEDKNTKEGYSLIRIQDNRVRKVNATEVRDFMIDFLEHRYHPIPLQNMILKTTQLSDSALLTLKKVFLDFTDFDKHYQFLFFRNKTWKVTKDDIKEFRPDDIDRFVWDDEVIDHPVKLDKDPAFKITYNESRNGYDIIIHDDSSMLLRVLINTSRMHWRKELEVELDKKDEKDRIEYREKYKFAIDGPLLSDEEIWEQKQHLINKIFAFGYLIHRDKNPSRPWCVFCMDYRISEEGASNGRSGKSFVFKYPRELMLSVTLSGRNPKLTENPHIYDRVTEYVDYILIDDSNEYLKFGFFFDATTGELNVNPKNNKSYEIPFAKAPKFCITSNFTLRNIDSSTEARILYTVFSDYYHENTNEHYRETRKISDDFGKNLIRDYDDQEWNADLNVVALCTKFFMSRATEKVQPPMDMVKQRNLRSEMGEGFKDWADVYFSIDSEQVDKLVVKSEAFKDFKEETGAAKMMAIHKFTKKLKAWAAYTYYVICLDPLEMKNSQGRIIRKNENQKTEEYIFVQTEKIKDAKHLANNEPKPGNKLF